jgi:hypothetical protein
MAYTFINLFTQKLIAEILITNSINYWALYSNFYNNSFKEIKVLCLSKFNNQTLYLYTTKQFDSYLIMLITYLTRSPP